MIATLLTLFMTLFLPLNGNGSSRTPYLLLPAEYTALVEDPTVAQDKTTELYKKLGLEEDKLSFQAFKLGVEGYDRIERKNRAVLTIIDFSKPSTQERMFVIDMEHEKLLYSTLCAHGKNSGGNYATSFSNQVNSHKSSLGFYLTGETYKGGNGYSLRLDGLEKGINDHAYERSIVVHGARYVSEQVAEQGRLGRSFGCPAVPTALAVPIINAIKDGSVLYIYAQDNRYITRSKIARMPSNQAELHANAHQPGSEQNS